MFSTQEYTAKMGNGRSKIILLSILITAIAVGSLIFLMFKKPVCGNDVCEPGENCVVCMKDCACPQGLYCSKELKSCVKPTCGNKVCELFETPDECCIDCECWNTGEVCNLKTNKCEKREIKISDERIREIVLEYFKQKNKEVVSMNITNLITWKNKLGKNVMVFIKGVDWFIPVIVTEDEEIVEVQA
jgi:hypothetical protein